VCLCIFFFQLLFHIELLLRFFFFGVLIVQVVTILENCIVQINNVDVSVKGDEHVGLAFFCHEERKKCNTKKSFARALICVLQELLLLIAASYNVCI